MIKNLLRLPVRIGYIGGVHPLVQQKQFSAGFRRHPRRCRQVPALHRQHQLCLSQHRRLKLASPVARCIDPVFFQKRHGMTFHRMTHQRSQPGAGDLNIATDQLLTEKKLRRGTAADVADTNDKDPFEHAPQEPRYSLKGNQSRERAPRLKAIRLKKSEG